MKIRPNEGGLRENLFQIPFPPAITEGPFVSLEQPANSLESGLLGYWGPSEELQERAGVTEDSRMHLAASNRGLFIHKTRNLEMGGHCSWFRRSTMLLANVLACFVTQDGCYNSSCHNHEED